MNDTRVKSQESDEDEQLDTFLIAATSPTPNKSYDLADIDRDIPFEYNPYLDDIQPRQHKPSIFKSIRKRIESNIT